MSPDKSPGTGSAPPFSYPSIISERLRTYQLHLEAFKKSVTTADLLVKSGRTVKAILECVSESLHGELESKVHQLEQTEDQRVKASISNTAILQLEHFFDYATRLVQSASEIQHDDKNVGREIYHFVHNILDDFKESPLTILVVTGPALETHKLYSRLRSYLSFFQATSDTIRREESQDRTWVISVPFSLLRNPLNWVLVCHEIAHIFEREHIGVVAREFQALRSSGGGPSERVIELQEAHAREYQADFLASLYMGPVYSRILVANHFTREVNLPGTHPEWIERVGLISTASLEEHAGRFAGPDHSIRGYQADEEADLWGGLRGMFRPEQIAQLPVILSATAQFLQQHTSHDRFRADPLLGPYFNWQRFESSHARDAISQLLPYTRDFRYALNAGAERTGYQSAKKLSREMGLDDTEATYEFNRLLAESIRLSYVSSRYKVWLSTGPQKQLY